MRETVYYQCGVADPILKESLTLDIVRQYAPSAGEVRQIDESGGEARVYAIDDNIILKVQRPQQLRSSTSLEKEAFFSVSWNCVPMSAFRGYWAMAAAIPSSTSA